jgi:hypothetical protein
MFLVFIVYNRISYLTFYFELLDVLKSIAAKMYYTRRSCFGFMVLRVRCLLFN